MVDRPVTTQSRDKIIFSMAKDPGKLVDQTGCVTRGPRVSQNVVDHIRCAESLAWDSKPFGV